MSNKIKKVNANVDRVFSTQNSDIRLFEDKKALTFKTPWPRLSSLKK